MEGTQHTGERGVFLCCDNFFLSLKFSHKQFLIIKKENHFGFLREQLFIS